MRGCTTPARRRRGNTWLLISCAHTPTTASTTTITTTLHRLAPRNIGLALGYGGLGAWEFTFAGERGERDASEAEAIPRGPEHAHHRLARDNSRLNSGGMAGPRRLGTGPPSEPDAPRQGRRRHTPYTPYTVDYIWNACGGSARLWLVLQGRNRAAVFRLDSTAGKTKHCPRRKGFLDIPHWSLDESRGQIIFGVPRAVGTTPVCDGIWP
ncbi:hypothetical protein EDC01DRAFT_163055 [Geopyxis carbonaria]|nr:hypothetical protein EDC01DRAFT_163055 [Geopyxis carbonaria]